MLTDLHVHSNRSDGTCSPEEVIDRAIATGLSYLAICDHDTVEGYLCARDYLAALVDTRGLVLIPGIEVSGQYDKRDVHILGYNIDAEALQQNEALSKARDDRLHRTLKMAVMLEKDGYPIRAQELADSGDTINRTAIARRLVHAGVVPTVSDAFEELIGDGCPYYIARNEMAAEDVIRLILGFGGLPVLAHPWLYHMIDAIEPLSKIGLMGVEAFHGEQPLDASWELARLADSLGLLVTGGSDWHGDGVHSASMGAVALPEKYLERYLASRP